MGLERQLIKIFGENENKRIIVVGTTCTGKSTLVKGFSQAKDMDKIVFPLITKEEAEYVCQSPWTEEIGKKMTELVREKVKVMPGQPVFGTVVLDSDLIVYLKISDKLLKERAMQRGASFKDVKNMQNQIEREIKETKMPVIELLEN